MVATTLQSQTLEAIHSSTTAAHLRVSKILQKLRTKLYWPWHKKNVSVVVSSCLVCQQSNSLKQKQRHSLVNWPPRFPFARIGENFFGPLPVSNGIWYKTLVCDRFTKWYETVRLPDKAAEMTATAQLEHWISYLGSHTNQGQNLESNLFQSLMQSLQIDETRFISLHPQSNAKIERMNRTLVNMSAKTVDDFRRNWPQQLPYVVMAFWSPVRESTGYTPQFLLLDDEIKIPIDIEYPSPEHFNKTDIHQFVQKNVCTCKELTK